MISQLSTDVIFGDHQEDDFIREIRCIVTNAKDEIRRIVAAAQEKLHRLKAGLCGPLDEKTCLTECVDFEPSSDQSYNMVKWKETTSIAQTCPRDNHGDSSPRVNGEDNTDSHMDDLTLHLELSFDVDDQDESDKCSSGSGVEVPHDIQGLSASNYPPIIFPATEFPGDVIDVNLLCEPTSDHCDVSLDALKNTECRSSEEADHHPTPSWRWPGIRKIPNHRMPQDTSSAKRQRGVATWRRRWRCRNRPTKLHLLQVRKHKQKVEYGYHRKGNRSLHKIVYLTLCILKNQRMGPAMRKQKRPLACWRYSRTNTHGVDQKLGFCSLMDSGREVFTNDMTNVSLAECRDH